MRSSSGPSGAGRIGRKVVACGLAIVLAAALAMRAVEAAASGDPPSAALQGTLAVAAAAAAYALWGRMRRAADEKVAWEMRAGRRDPSGRLRNGDDDA